MEALTRIPIFLTVFIVFLLVYAFRRAQLASRKEQREKEFWDREEAAKHAPAVDLSTIEYVTVPLDRFPFGEIDEDELLWIEQAIRDLAEQPMLQLKGQTNTDIKLNYGTANFETVVRMGERLDEMMVLLCDYAKGLMEQGRGDLAIPVLEYGIEAGSDISANYTLLGDCYRAAGQQEKLAMLRRTVADSGLLLKDKILAELSDENP